MITKATVSRTVICAAFYPCSVECAMCSEMKDENAIEHDRLSQ